MKKSILTSFALVLFALGASAQVVTYPNLVQTYKQKVQMVATAVTTDGTGGGGGGTGGTGGTTVDLAQVDFAFNTAAHYADGISGKVGHNFLITSTSPWLLQVKAETDLFTALTTSGSDISHDKLAWALASDGTYTSLSTDFAAVTSGSLGSPLTAGHDFTVYYKLNPGAVAPDTYSMNVIYTLSVQ